MITLNASTVINRPIEDVFGVLSNLENHPKWNAAFLEVKKTSPGPISVGTTWRTIQKRLLGQRIESEVEVTEYESNRKITEKSKSPFPVEVQMTFANDEGGTRVNLRLEAEPGGFVKVAEPLAKSMGKRSSEADLANLKDLMEAHAL